MKAGLARWRLSRPAVLFCMVAILQGCAPSPTPASPPDQTSGSPRGQASVFLEDMTWTELRDAIKAGRTTIIIPVGGVEQSGPYIALGKHDARVRLLSERIARNLGNTIVAPVIAYVPEGSIDPPTEHMRFPGTITLPPDVFRQTLEWAAMSFRLHGFRDVVILGDHGGYQGDLKAVADDLNRKWAGTATRAHFVAQYYGATQTTYVAALQQRGFSQAEIGVHAGLADTALTQALAPDMVRSDHLGVRPAPGPDDGVHGDPTHATPALGDLGAEAIVNETTAAIRAAVQRP